MISLDKFRADRKIYGHYFDNFQKIPLKYSHVLRPLFWKYAVKNFNSLWKCPLVSYISMGNSNFKPIFRWKSYSKIKLNYGYEENNTFSDTSCSFRWFSLSDMLNHILKYRWVITNLPVCASVVGCRHGSEGEGLSIPHFCVGPNPKYSEQFTFFRNKDGRISRSLINTTVSVLYIVNVSESYTNGRSRRRQSGNGPGRYAPFTSATLL